MTSTKGKARSDGAGEGQTSEDARQNDSREAVQAMLGVSGQAAGELTGNMIVLFREGAAQDGMRSLTRSAGVRMVRASEFEEGVPTAEAIQEGGFVLERIGCAIVPVRPDQVASVSQLGAQDDSILAIEPERIVSIPEDQQLAYMSPMWGAGAGYAADLLPAWGAPPLAAPTPYSQAPLSMEYLTGYQEAVNQLVSRLMAGTQQDARASQVLARPAQTFQDSAEFTWGLQATKVPQSRKTGRGIRVAVLDTGIDLGHPDFVGRPIVSRSFIPGEAVQDGQGHGTHCIGTACGPLRPQQGPRYGVANEAEIFAGKVLSNRGSGSDAGILAGIEWALSQQCAIISMSLGAPVMPGQRFSTVYETVARRALAAGTLIIAAAGNESVPPGTLRPVGHPANCPSILAVGAVGHQLAVASFSSRGLIGKGGQVDIAAPGVQVLSSLPRPRLYGRLSGTSMATPHVAGIAALLAEANPGVVGGALGWLLLQSSLRLDQPAVDVGVGLAQAPVE